MKPVHYFCVSFGRDLGRTPMLELHGAIAHAKKAGVSLALDGLIYAIEGEAPLAPGDNASRLLDSYLREPRGFFDRVRGQYALAIVEKSGRAVCHRSELSPVLVYYSDRAISNRLKPVVDEAD